MLKLPRPAVDRLSMESTPWGEPSLSQADSWPPADIRRDVLGRRIVASVVDFLILLVVFLGLAAITHSIRTTTGTTATGYHSTRFSLSAGMEGISFVGWMLYYFAFESLIGQTPGKMLTGLQVVGLDGRAASTGAILVRTVGRIIDAPFFYLVGFISMLCGPAPRKRVGDRMASTTVAPV